MLSVLGGLLSVPGSRYLMRENQMLFSKAIFKRFEFSNEFVFEDIFGKICS